MNQEYICNELECSNLNDYVFNEIKLGYEKSIILSDKYIQNILTEIRELDSDKKTTHIFYHISLLKKAKLEISSESFIHYFNESKKFKSPKTLDFNNEIINLSEYIVKYFNLICHSEKEIVDELRKINNKSFMFFFSNSIYEKGIILFEELKLIPEIKPLEWSYSNIDLGLLQNYILHKIDNHSALETNDIKYIRTIEHLEYSIENLNADLEASKKKIEFHDEYYNKYYYSTEPLLKDTYFGDNQPLIHCLYNFLKENNCLDYGWSYFYNCLTTHNNEVINLKSIQTNYFFGNLFWELSRFLKEPYKYEFKRFFYNKFYIGEKPLKESFFRNYYRKYKNDEHESLEKISVLMLKLEKTHHK